MASADQAGILWGTRVRLSRILILALVGVLAAAWPVNAGSAKVIFSGPSSSRAVALTFDDGWGPTQCQSIGKTLRRAGVKATFFINGRYLRSKPSKWRAILKGMPVANHTKSHVNLATAARSLIAREIRTNEAIHEKVLGRRMLKLLRPPYGAYNDRVRNVASNLGYKHLIIWNTSAADTSSAATTRSVIKRTTGQAPGAIILMHCGSVATANALPTIIRHYKSRGIKMVGLRRMLGVG